MNQRRYRTNRYIQVLPLDDGQVVVGNPFLLQRQVLSEEMGSFLELFAKTPRTAVELYELVEPAELVDEMLKYFLRQQLLVEEGFDEASQLRADLKMAVGEVAVRTYRSPIQIGLEAMTPRLPIGRVASLRMLLMGGCFTQLAADAVEAFGPSYGLDVRVDTAWPDNVEMIQRVSPDVVVLQLSTTWLLTPLWDEAPFVDDDERLRRLSVMMEAVTVAFGKVVAHCPDRLLLVQTFSTPQLSPFGATEFRRRCTFSDIVYELNSLLARLAREHLNVLLVDEGRIASNVGKARLLDGGIVPFSHHAPIDSCCGPIPRGPSREVTWGVEMACHMPQLLAREYLDLYTLWTGRGQIKCVIVDLDNTLWPGIAGDADFSLEDSDQIFRFGPYGGLHQALKILRSRGLLLATCSKNNPGDIDRVWAELDKIRAQEGMNHLLARDDFVLHKINWERKSTNLRQIAMALGLAEEGMLFIDDDAVERAEAKAGMPNLRVLGENYNLLRATLLSDPCLQVNVASRESSRRTEIARAQLARDAAHCELPDEATFLRSLDIRLGVTRVVSERAVPRIVELSQRTNQFNTTLIRHDAPAINRLLAKSSAAMFTLDARDRFTSYGLVGLCILDGHRIEVLLLSCRVLGLQPAVPFVVTALRTANVFPIETRIVEGPRNQPCRNVYRQCGFKETGHNEFVIEQQGDLVSVDSSIYAVEVFES